MCDEGWDETDVIVLCKELGFVYGYVIINVDIIKGDLLIFTDVFWKFNCIGNEIILVNCIKVDYW